MKWAALLAVLPLQAAGASLQSAEDQRLREITRFGPGACVSAFVSAAPSATCVVQTDCAQQPSFATYALRLICVDQDGGQVLHKAKALRGSIQPMPKLVQLHVPDSRSLPTPAPRTAVGLLRVKARKGAASSGALSGAAVQEIAASVVRAQHEAEEAANQAELDASNASSAQGGQLEQLTDAKRKSRIPALLESAEGMEQANGQFLDSLDQSDTPEPRLKKSGVEKDPQDLDDLMRPDDDEDLAFTKHYHKLSLMEKLKAFLVSNRYEVAVAGLLCLNVLWMAIELQFFGAQMSYLLGLTSEEMDPEVQESWAGVFSSLGCPQAVNYIDVAVTVTSLTEVMIFYAVKLPVNPILFRLLRIGKLARAVMQFACCRFDFVLVEMQGMVTMNSVLASLQLLIKCIAASMNMLFWSFCLLTFVQCVAGMVASTLCRDFIEDPLVPVDLRIEVYKYYGTFTRTFLTMFDSRWQVVVENISEWFSLFFLSYRCVLGFAVLNVVNAVFVQQTMKTASSDEELAFKQKERDATLYTRPLALLTAFAGAPEEFARLVNSPMLKFWMGQLELEYHDLMSLFEFLDNGDGEITLMEFIDGAARLKGGAKALDIWRIETKLEVLLGEILAEIKGDTQAVQHAFEQSEYDHIKATKRERRSIIEEDVSAAISDVDTKPSQRQVSSPRGAKSDLKKIFDSYVTKSRRRVTVRVPATTANMGPGFDCAGMALDVWNELTVERASSFSIEIEGEGARMLPRDRSNLVVKGVEAAYKYIEQEVPILRYWTLNRIPFAKGMGSSRSFHQDRHHLVALGLKLAWTCDVWLEILQMCCREAHGLVLRLQLWWLW
eukprot:g20288.t1